MISVSEAGGNDSFFHPANRFIAFEVFTRDRENDPFGDVGRVVADPLEVFGHHQKILRLIGVVGVGTDQIDQFAANL